MKVSDLQQAADRASALLKALAGRNRLMILCQLVEGERSVGELARLIGARETAVSQQLALLRAQGLVSTRRDGQTIHYALASPEAAAVIATLYRLYCAAEQPDAAAAADQETEPA